MASNVENRVVSMTFDNARFERNVSSTISTLDKLKGALNFSNTSKSINDVSAAANNMDLSPMGSKIDGVSAKFLALSTIAVTALSRITSSAIDAGTRIVKALTIDPVVAGYKEYETQINAVQTILANTSAKGTNLEQVNSALDELNTYADQTIYNFSEMTRNIGTFTAAGVGLDQSVASIKGIANLAAVSGSNSQQASTAMYQLSQAIASGSVKLMDWNSVVNAGMGGEVFQKALFETGKAMKTITNVPIDQSFDDWKASGNSFRESLQDGWLTAEVLTTTLKGFTKELDVGELKAKGFTDAQIAAMQQMAATATAAATEVKTGTQLVSVIQEAISSGWATTFRTVIGDFEEAKQLYSGVAAIITTPLAEISDRRNKMLEGWKALGGRDTLIEGLYKGLDALKTVLAPIKMAFMELFPRTAVTDLVALTQRFSNWTESLKIGEGTMKTIYHVFRGVFSVMALGKDVVFGLGKVFGSLVGAAFKILGAFASLGGGLGGLLFNFRATLNSGDVVGGFFDNIASAISRAADLIVTFVATLTPVADKTIGLLSKVAGYVAEFAGQVSNFIGGLFGGEGGGGGPEVPGWLEDFGDFFSNLKDSFSSGASAVFETIVDGISSALDGLSAAFDGVKGAGSAAGGVLASVGGFFQRIGEGIVNAAKSVGSWVSDFVSSIVDGFSNADFGKAGQVAGLGIVGVLSAALFNFSRNGMQIDFGQFNFLERLDGVFEGVTDTLSAMQQQIKANILLKIAGAIGVLTVSLIALSMLDGPTLARSLTAVGVGMSALLGSLAVLSKLDVTGLKMTGLTASLVLLGISLVALSIAIKLFSTIEPSELIQGIIGIAASLAVMVGAAALLQKVEGSIARVAAGLFLLGLSLSVFAASVWLFAKLELKDLAQGLGAIAVTMGVLVGATRLMGEGDIIKLGLSFTLFGIGLFALQRVVSAFAKMPWQELLQGFIGLAATLGILIAATRLFPPEEDMLKMGAGMLLMAGSIAVLSVALIQIAGLSLTELIKGLIGMAGAAAIMVLAANSMTGSLAGAGAMIVMAGALYVLGQVLKTIGELSIGQIIAGLLGIAGVIVVLGALAAVLVIFPPILLAMKGLGIALLLIGAGFAAFGIGAKLTAEAFIMLGKAGKSSVTALIEILNVIIRAIPGFVQAFGEGIGQMVIALLNLAPQMMEAFGNMLVSLLDLIIRLAPKIGEAFGALISAAITVIREKVPELIEAGLEILLAFLKGIRDNIGEIVTLVGEIIVEFINALSNQIDAIVSAGVNLLIQFLVGLAQDLWRIGEAVTTIITELITAIGGWAGDIAQAGVDAFIEFVTGLTKDIIRLTRAVTTLMVYLFWELATQAVLLIDAGVDALLFFIEGLTKNVIEFVNGVGQIMLNFLANLRYSIDKYGPQITIEGYRIAGALINAITGGMAKKVRDWIFGGGIASVFGPITNGVRGFFEMRSPSRVFREIAYGLIEGFALGLEDTRLAEDGATTMAVRTTRAFEDAIRPLPGLLADMEEFNPTITPVLDLTKVQRDAKALRSLADVPGVPASTSVAQANVIATSSNRPTKVEMDNPPGPTEVSFEQNIYAPRQLSAADIYRQTRSQITMAKEELRIR